MFRASLRPSSGGRTLHEDQYTFLIISRPFLLRMRNVSDKVVGENKNTHFMFNDSPSPPPEKRAVYGIMWKNRYCRAGQATDENTAHALCLLNNSGYKHTLTICNIYCFSTATVVARKRLNVTLYVYWLSCSVLMSHETASVLVSMLASGSRVRGFEPDRSRWIFSDVKKSSACLPSEGK
jgi:hypothetical protein